MRVIFPVVKEEGSNKIILPDDRKYFRNGETVDGNVIADYTGELNLTEYIEPVLKTIYSSTDFIAKIPKGKIRNIQTAALTNDDINVWVFNLPMLTEIDLNYLPVWFTEGLDGMVTEGIFTQLQINNFLEI